MNKIKAMMGTYPMAADQWLMVLALIHVFGHTIPWYVWAIFAVEFIGAVVAVTAAKLKDKAEGS